MGTMYTSQIYIKNSLLVDLVVVPIRLTRRVRTAGSLLSLLVYPAEERSGYLTWHWRFPLALCLGLMVKTANNKMETVRINNGGKTMDVRMCFICIKCVLSAGFYLVGAWSRSFILVFSRFKSVVLCYHSVTQLIQSFRIITSRSCGDKQINLY